MAKESGPRRASGRVTFLTPGVTTGVSSGPFAIAPWRVRTATASAAGVAGQGPRVKVVILMYAMGVDPRVKLTQAPVVETESIVDGAGVEVVPAGAARPGVSTVAGRWAYTPVQQL